MLKELSQPHERDNGKKESHQEKTSSPNLERLRRMHRLPDRELSKADAKGKALASPDGEDLSQGRAMSEDSQPVPKIELPSPLTDDRKGRLRGGMGGCLSKHKEGFDSDASSSRTSDSAAERLPRRGKERLDQQASTSTSDDAEIEMLSRRSNELRTRRKDALTSPIYPLPEEWHRSRERTNHRTEQQLQDHLKGFGFKPNDDGWLESYEGQRFLDDHAHEFIKLEQGRQWLERHGRQWFEYDHRRVRECMWRGADELIQTKQGNAWYHDNGKGKEWLNTSSDASMFLTLRRYAFMQTDEGKAWFYESMQTARGVERHLDWEANKIGIRLRDLRGY